MVMITSPEFLEALLSSHSDKRRQAETILQAMTLEARCEAWLQGLASALEPALQIPYQHHQLMAVLLRRDILLFTDVGKLMAMVGPLLNLAVAESVNEIRRALGDCLVEICASLSLLAPEQSQATLEAIVHGFGTRATQADGPSLQLLTKLAHRAPTVFSAVALQSLPSLIAQALEHMRSFAPSFQSAGQIHRRDQTLVYLTELVVVSAQASNSTKNSLLAQVDAQLGDQVSHPIVLDPSSTASRLGQSCLLPILQGMPTVTTTADSIQSIFEHLIQAADQIPDLLAGSTMVMQSLLETVLMGISQHSSDPYIQLQAIQVVATLLAHADVRHKRLDVNCRHLLLERGQILQICLHLLETGVDGDLEGWAREPPNLQADEYWEGDELAEHAEELIESLLVATGTPGLMHILATVEGWLQPPMNDWRKHRAALAALRCSAQAAPSAFTPHVSVAAEAALACLPPVASVDREGLLRVQHQAIMLIAALCEVGDGTTLSPEVAVRCLHALALASLSECHRVAALACLGLVSYCRRIDAEDKEEVEQNLLPYCQDVLNMLAQGALGTASRNQADLVVKLRAVGVIATIAQTTGSDFSLFYSACMPILVKLIQIGKEQQCESSQNMLEDSRLRGGALEAAAIVMQAVRDGNANVEADGLYILNGLVPLIQADSEGKEIEIPMDDILAAFARIAGVIGEAYAPFVDIIMPLLLHRATSPGDISITDEHEHVCNTEHDEGDFGNLSIVIPGRGVTWFTVNSARIQVKIHATRAIYEHVTSLGSFSWFTKYLTVLIDSFLPIIALAVSSDVQTISAQLLAAAFERECDHSETVSMETSIKHFSVLSDTLAQKLVNNDNPDLETIQPFADSLCEVCFSVYSRFEQVKTFIPIHLSMVETSTIVDNCMTAVRNCIERRSHYALILYGESSVGDDERDGVEQSLRREQTLLTSLVDSVGYFMKIFRSEFLPIFEAKVAPLLGPFLECGFDTRARLASVCLFDDCVEHCGIQGATKFAQNLVIGVVAGMDDTRNGADPELKRAAIYGLAQLARHAPEVLKPHAGSLARKLLMILECPRNGSNEDDALYENAVSALASLVLLPKAPFRNDCLVPHDSVVESFLSNLPMREDVDEAKLCHSGLCDLVEHREIAVHGRPGELMRIIGEVFVLLDEGEDIASYETAARFTQILRWMQREVSSDILQESFTSLSEESRESINIALGHHAHNFGNVISP